MGETMGDNMNLDEALEVALNALADRPSGPDAKQVLAVIRAAAWDEGKNAVWAFMSNQDPRRERPANPYRAAK